MKLMELPNFYIGTDITEVKRINKLLLRIGERFKNKVFTTLEQKYCDSKSIPAIHYAGRFSAKEAIIKSIKSSGYKNTISFKSIEVLPSDSGIPLVFLHFELECECKVSISHINSYATATALYIQK
ncbi:MAG: holo-[acyl-carrier-protein] synthase [bacterium TMED264]|mgnify:CR=1 FL=1|nr:MAG: holo-[acyl-carrier-protein] synthase [bacterium TMED264]